LSAVQRVTDRSGLLTLLALLSGSCGLAYEILYMRAMTTLLGDMLYVHSALLSTFLIGIGLGAILARRWFRWLWVFEVLTGVCALALPVVSRWLADQSVMLQITARPSLTILVTIAFLVLPGLFVGFSIPLFSAYIKACAKERLAFQGIYMAYNLGALMSVLAVELFLVQLLGVTWSLAAIGAVNVFNGIVLLVTHSAPQTIPSEQQRRFPRRMLVALALASGVSAVFQMFFIKLSYLLFYPHRENFAIALSVTLLGIFVGAWIASKVRATFATFVALVPLALGLTFTCYIPLLRLQEATYPHTSSELLITMQKFGVASMFALGPMILFGAMLPALMRHEREVAGESGQLLCISSMANAAGYLVYVLIGHPLLPTHVLLAILAGLALLSSLLSVSFRWTKTQVAIALAGVGLTVTLLFTWQERNFYLAQWFDDLDPIDEVTVYKSGAESATLLTTPEYEWVTYNGHPSIFVSDNGVVTLAETMSGVIPALSAPRLENVLVLGLGTGITAGASGQLFDHTDVVEINNAFYKMMPRLSYANLDIGNNATVDRHLADGRAFLVGKDGTYDAILNSIPAPTYYSASKIYTLEFYERVVRALKPDGVFCSWLSVINMSQEGTETVLAALRQNFEYCDLRLMTGAYYMATCSNEPIRVRDFRDLPVSLDLIDQLQTALPEFDLGEYFRDIRVSDNLFESYEPGVTHQNTDDHPVLEFMVVRNFLTENQGEDLFVTQQELLNIDPVRLDDLADSAALARRAVTFYFLGSKYFEQDLLPVVRSDPEAWALWGKWGLVKGSERQPGPGPPGER